MRRQVDNLSGKTFGRLRAVTPVNPGSIARKVRWDCLCACGNATRVLAVSLIYGATKSCGCLASEGARLRRTTHGYSRSPEFEALMGARRRCGNPKEAAYANYGGRGVKVSKLWEGPRGFETFLAHVGPRPSPRHSLDRKNNDGNYEPGNVQWSTRSEQNRNRRRTAAIENFSTEELENELARRVVEAGVIPLFDLSV